MLWENLPLCSYHLDYKCNHFWASDTLWPHLGLLLPEWWIRTTLLFQEKPCMLWEELPYLGCRRSSLGLGWPGPPGHLLPELYTRMTQHELWPECKTMTKADHLETL